MDVMMNMTTEDVRRLRGKFTGSLRLEEFVLLMKKSLRDRIHSELDFVVGVIELFHTIDVNGDAVLDWDEFAAYMMDAGQAKEDLYFEGRCRAAKHYAPLPLPPRDAKTPLNNIRTRVQQMRLLADQGAVAYFEVDSDVVYLYGLLFDRNDGPRHLSTIRLHTAFQEHTIIDVVYVPTRKSLVISSVLTRGYLSLWNVSDLRAPVMTRRLESSEAQELLCWVPSLQSLATSSVVYPSLFSGRPSASRQDSYRPNAGVDQPHTKINQLVLWDLSGKVRAPAAGTIATREVTVVQERIKGITALAVYRSINRTYLAVGREDGILAIVDAESGEEVSSFDAHGHGVKVLVYSTEVECLASVGFYSYADETTLHIAVWKKTGAAGLLVPEATLKQHEAAVELLAFVDSNQQLVSVDRSETFNIYSSVTRTPTSEPWECLQTFQSAAFAPAAWSRLPPQRVWSMFVVPETAASDAVLVTAGHTVAFYDYCEEKDREEVFFAYYCSTLNLVVGATSTKLLLWKADTGNLWKVYEYVAIVMATTNPSVTSARLSKAKKVDDPETREAQARAMTAVCVDDRERKVIIGDDTGSIKVLNAVNGNVMKELDPHATTIIHIAYVLYGKRVISISTDSVLHICDENNPLGFYVPFGGSSVQSVLLRSLRLLSEAPVSSVQNEHNKIRGGPNQQQECTEEQHEDLKYHHQRLRHGGKEEPDKFLFVKSVGNQELNLVAVLMSGPHSESFVQVWNFDMSHSQGTCVAPPGAGEITCLSFLGSAADIVAGTLSGRVFLWSPQSRVSSYRCLMELVWSPATPVVGEMESKRHLAPITQLCTVCETETEDPGQQLEAMVPPVSYTSHGKQPSRPASNSSSMSAKELARMFLSRQTIDDRIRYESECGVQVLAADEAGFVTRWSLQRSRGPDLTFITLGEDGSYTVEDNAQQASSVRPPTRRSRTAASGAEAATFQHEETTISFDTVAALHEHACKESSRHQQSDSSNLSALEICSALGHWKAHSGAVLSLEVATDPYAALTSSVSGQIKIWSVGGHLLGVLDHFATRRAPLEHPWSFPVDMEARRLQKEEEAQEFLHKPHDSYWKKSLKPRESVLQQRLSLTERDLSFSHEPLKMRKQRGHARQSDVGRAVRHYILAQVTGAKSAAKRQRVQVTAPNPDRKAMNQDSESLHTVLKDLEQFQLQTDGSSDYSSGRMEGGDVRSKRYTMVTLADIKNTLIRPRTTNSVHCDLPRPHGAIATAGDSTVGQNSAKKRTLQNCKSLPAISRLGVEAVKRKELVVSSTPAMSTSSAANQAELAEYLAEATRSNQEKDPARAGSASDTGNGGERRRTQREERPRTREAGDGVLRYHVKLAHTWQQYQHSERLGWARLR